MDKKTIIGALLGGALVIALAVFLFFQPFAKETSLEELEGKITYYYGFNCPHCQDVLRFVEENKIEEKVSFTKKEIYKDATNSREFAAVAKKCGISLSEAGVPLVYADGRCFMGGPDVTNFFKEKAGIGQ